MLSWMREGVQQIEFLEHKPQMCPAGRRPASILRDFGQGLAVEQDLTGGGTIQGGQDVQQGGLAGAGLAHDGHIFSRFHREIHVAQGFYLVAAETGGVNFFANDALLTETWNSFLLFVLYPNPKPERLPSLWLTVRL